MQSRSLTAMVARTWRGTMALMTLVLVTTGLAVGLSAAVLHPQMAANQRARVLIDQFHEGMLDEETGLRGWLLTGRHDFLEPYQSGSQLVTAARAALRNQPGLDAMWRAEQQWHQEWAMPALHRTTGAWTTEDGFVASGKNLFDAYRVTESAAAARVSTAVTTADRRTTELLWTSLAIGLLSGLVAMVLGLTRLRGLRGAIVTPVEQLMANMQAHENGDAARPLDASAPVELQSLDERLTAMTAELTRAREQELAARADATAVLAYHAQQMVDVVTLQQDVAAAGLTRGRILRVVAQRLLELTRADGAAVLMRHGDSLLWEATAGLSHSRHGRTMSVAGSLAGRCLHSGTPLRCDDTDVDDRVDQITNAAVKARSVVLVPLRHEGNPVGVLALQSSRPFAFDNDDESVLMLVAGFVATALAHADDYSDKVRLLEVQAEVESALRESESRFRSSFANAPIGNALVGTDLCIRRANARLAAILGVAETALHGKSLLDFAHPDDGPLVLAGGRHLLEGERDHLEVELRLTDADGRAIVAMVTASLVRDGDGNPMHFIVQVQDITARREMERSLAAALEELETRAGELERSNRDLSQFAYIASHDLAEPLRVIRGFTSLLLEEVTVEPGSDAADFAAHINAGVTRMQDLLAGLLTYSRAGSSEVKRGRVDMGELAEFVGDDLATALQESSAELAVGSLPVVGGDPTLLRQVLQNLVANAVKFVAPGDVPRIEITGREGRTGVEIRVIDHGIGIPAEYRERVFGMFQRLHARDEYAGTGIGLAVAQRIVMRHGGALTVEDTPGGGTTFCIHLPRVPFAVEPEPSPELVA